MSRNKRKVSILLIVLMVFSLSSFYPAPSFASPTQERELSLGAKEINGRLFLGKPELTSYEVPFSNNGLSIDSWEVVMPDGTVEENYGSWNGSTLTIPNIQGKPVTVYQETYSNPGHIISRTVDGTGWTVGANDPIMGNYYSTTVDGACFDSDGISQCPAPYPSRVPDFLNDNGRAVTESMNVPPPTSFVLNESDVGKTSVVGLTSSYVDSTSYYVIPSKSTPITDGVQILAGGNGNIGRGHIKVSRTLGDDRNEYELMDFTGAEGHNEMRNYNMEINVFWEATTYEYTGVKVKVYYEEGDLYGDFTIDPNPITYGDSFTFTETSLVNHTGKEIKETRWVIHNSDSTKHSTSYPKETTTGVGITPMKYPSFLTDSTQDYNVTMEVRLDGESEFRHLNNKTLQVKASEDDGEGDDGEGDGGDGDGANEPDPEPEPPRNNPPWVETWFEKEGIRIDTAVQGETVELVAEYGDPDGDPLSKRWEFEAPLDTYGLSTTSDRQTVTLTDQGRLRATMTVTDPSGASAYSTAYIDVIDPTPIAVITGPPAAKQGRPLPYDFDGTRSHSPIHREIVEYDWTNKRDVYQTPGTETIRLRVRDEDGRWSARVDHPIRVVPDEPPVAQLEVPSETTRLNEVTIQLTSFSPDLDPIDKHTVEVRYDRSNNGSYSGWTTLAEGNMRSVLYKPDDVGKRQFRVTSCESFGLCDTSAPVTMDVVNLPPHVDVETSGDLEQPTDKTIVPMNTVFNSWTLRQPNGSAGDKGFWRMSGGMLETFVTSNMRAFNSRAERTAGYNRSGSRATRSFSQGRDNPLQTIYASLQSSHYEVISLGNFTSDPVTHHDDLFVYTFGYNNGATLKAFTKDFVPVWAKSYSGYSRLQQVVTYDGKLFAILGNHAGTYTFAEIHQADGNLVAATNLPTRAEIVAMYKDQAIIVSNARGYALDLSTQQMKTIADLRLNNQSYYQVSDDFLLILEQTNSSERLIGFSLEDLAVKWTRSLANGGYYFSGERNAILGFNANLEAFLLDKESHTYAYTNKDVVPDSALSWYNEQGTQTHSKVYDDGWNRDDFRDHPIEMIPAAGHPDRSTLERYFYDTTYTSPLHEFGDFIGVNSLEQLFFHYDSVHSSSTNSGIVVYDGYGEIIKSYVQYAQFRPEGMYEGADGLTTIYGERNGNLQLLVFDQNLNVVVNETINISLPSSNHFGSNHYRYIGDQKFLVFHSSGASTLIDGSGRAPTYPKLFEPVTASFDHIWYGGTTLQNEVQELIFRPTETAEKSVGMAFRVQDHRNYYSIEFENNRVYLTRVRNGTKSTLRNTGYTLAAGSTYRVKVVPNGNKLEVYVNDIYQFDVTDNQFSQGRMGIINRGVTGVQYMELSYSTPGPGAGTITGIALVNETIHYAVSYEDPEGDPRLTSSERWVYTHDPSVFLKPQGTWAGSGQARSTAVTSFSQPGQYDFTFRTQDNPHSSSNFASYRQHSNTVRGSLRIHRAPIAQFTVSERSNHTLHYTDTSYDPDRYDPATGNYSRENTGIDYRATRGIIEHRWRWREASSNTYTAGILTNPPSAGEYIIELTVRDEYSAWSDWYSQTVTVGGAAGRDDPPRAGFTTNPTNTYRGVGVTINSTASDREDGGRGNLEHAYYIRNLTTGDGESFQSNARTSWTKTFTSLGTFQIRQVVTDSAGQTDQAMRQVTIQNRKPVATVQSPGSTNSNNPQELDDPRPIIRWTYSDQDSMDRQQRYQVRISRSNGTNVADSGIMDGSATQWQPSHGLPEDVNLRARVRVHDGYEWSDWSNMRHFIINTNKPPVADFDWSPKPVWEGDTITLSSKVSDPDLDPLAIQYTVVFPDGQVRTHEQLKHAPYDEEGPTFRAVDSGYYDVSITVSDGQAEPVVKQKTIKVNPLYVTGMIEHTAEWEEYRQTYNVLYPEKARGIDTFYAGEVFVLRAYVTDTTNSRTRAERVVVQMEGERGPETEELTSTDTLVWTGEMFRDYFPELPDGSYTFTFTAMWTNGVIKHEQVTIRIAGHMWERIGIHRVR